MDKKTTGIVATVITVLLCGCPGLFGLCFGAFFAIISRIPGADINVFGSSDPGRALKWGIGIFCLGIIFVIIPIVVGIVTLRKKNNGALPPVPDEPIPPAT